MYYNLKGKEDPRLVLPKVIKPKAPPAPPSPLLEYRFTCTQPWTIEFCKEHELKEWSENAKHSYVPVHCIGCMHFIKVENE